MTKPDISVVIVNRNTRMLLRNCLISLKNAAAAICFEVIVVDNGSSDDSVDMLTREFPNVLLIANRQNQGFASANNQGLRIAKGRYCLLLNSDTRAAPGALEQMISFMDTSLQAGACGPQLRYPDGSLQPSGRRFPTLLSVLGELLPVPENWRKWLRGPLEKRDYSQTREVDEVPGAALCLRRQALDQVGLLDTEFFFSGEDIDLCWRLKKAGWKIYYFADAQVVHHWGGSRSKREAFTYSLYAQRGYYLLSRKHFPRLESLILKLILILMTLVRLAKWLVLSLIKPGWIDPRQVTRLHALELSWLSRN